MWCSCRYVLQREMRQWPPSMRAVFLGWKRCNGITVDACFRCIHRSTVTLVARFALVRHRRSNVLFFALERHVPHARAARGALAVLPGVLQNRVLGYLRVPRLLPLKAWLRRLRPPGAAATTGSRAAGWSPADTLSRSWCEIQWHVRRAAASQDESSNGKKKPRLR